MLVTLSGIVMLVKFVQLKNAYCSILVTLSGIVMLVKLVHPKNAPEPIVVPPVTTTVFKDVGTVSELPFAPKM